MKAISSAAAPAAAEAATVSPTWNQTPAQRQNHPERTEMERIRVTAGLGGVIAASVILLLTGLPLDGLTLSS